MIHSLAGGELRTQTIKTLAKLQFEAEPKKFYWYICDIKNVCVGDFVLAPFGIIDSLHKARVMQIDKNVISTSFPISFDKLKSVYKKV